MNESLEHAITALVDCGFLVGFVAAALRYFATKIIIHFKATGKLWEFKLEEMKSLEEDE